MSRKELKQRDAINVHDTIANGLDDDGNGFIDDVSGWDFVEQDAVPMPASEDGDPSHGTKMAVVALRAADAVGVRRNGQSESIMILPLRVATGGIVDTTAVVRAVRYAGSRDEHVVVNLSMGTSRSSIPSALWVALVTQPNVVFVISAGNQGRNVDDLPASLCRSGQPNIVCVAAIDEEERLSSPPRASNFGRSVDLAALAVNVEIKDSMGVSRLDTGTSLAAADVSGVAAAVWAAAPDLPPAGIAQVLCDGARPSDSLGASVRCGIVDASRSLRLAVSIARMVVTTTF